MNPSPHGHRLGRVLVAMMFGSGLAAQADQPSFDLRAELERVVDTVRPKARRKAALGLAGRKDVTLDGLLQAMAKFGRFEKPDPGVAKTGQSLWNGKATERTEIHYFVPRSYDPSKPVPLMLTGHGTGGSGRGMTRAWHVLAETTGMIVVAPSEAGENNGWDFQARSRNATLSAIRWARRQFNIDENRVFLTGISRGGHMAWDLALRFPDRYAAIAPMIGSPRLNTARGQNNLRYLENVAHMPIRDLQGSKDDPRMVRNLRLAFEKLKELGAADAKLIEFPKLGHSFEFGAVDWAGFCGTARRDPVPTRIVRLVAAKNPAEQRAFWVAAVRTTRDVKETFKIKVNESEYKRWQRKGMHLLLVREADRHTGRIEAKMLGKGRFVIRTRYVRKVRLFLTGEMFERSKPVEIEINGKKRRKRAYRNKRVLCLEFAERFDRTFLPVAEVDT